MMALYTPLPASAMHRQTPFGRVIHIVEQHGKAIRFEVEDADGGRRWLDAWDLTP